MVQVGTIAHQGQEDNGVCTGDYGVISTCKGDLGGLLNYQAEVGSLKRVWHLELWLSQGLHQYKKPVVFTAYQHIDNDDINEKIHSMKSLFPGNLKAHP